LSPRPRKVADDEIFAAAYRAMQRLGPHELTLAAIAAEAGLTAGALVQRFGSKRQLQIALAQAVADSADDMIRALRARHSSALDTILDYADCMAQMAATPEALVRNLRYLTADVADPELRKPLTKQAQRTIAALRELLDEAVQRGELRRGIDTQSLARTLSTLIGGALFSWAVMREGTASRYMREHVNDLLDPFRTSNGSARRKTGRRR
jgi:AcrR family transcriptional regulator